MLWCLICLASAAALLGLAALRATLPRPSLPQLRPGKLLRGCLAGLCLLATLVFLGLALIEQRLQ